MSENETGTETTPEEPGRRPRITAAVVRHAYVAAATLVALAALVAAAVAGGGSDGGEAAPPEGERAEEYYKRLVTIGRGLIPEELGHAEFAALPDGISTLDDGTDFELSIDKDSRVTFLRITIVPGAAIPWHHHSSPLLISLVSGSVVDYRPDREGCTGEALPPGTTVFEPNTQVHTLTNPFDVPAVFYVVAWSPEGAEPELIELDPPVGCPAKPDQD